MPLYLCWSTDNGERDDARQINHVDAGAAAAEFAEQYDNDSAQWPDEQDVSVEAPDGTVTIFTVHAENTRSYSASRRKEAPRG
jgi:hypothetical protein